MPDRVGARTARAGSVLVLVIALTMAWAVAAWPARAGLTRPERAVSPASPVPPRPAIPASPASAGAPGWRISVARHYGKSADASGFSTVIAPGPATAWAFGGTNPGQASKPVAMRWTSQGWRSWPLPRGLTGFIGDASAPSMRDIWAVSYGAGYVLHWNGTRWSVARRWPEHHVLTGVTAVRPSDVWVFGTTTAGVRGMGTWHFSGHRWARVHGLAGHIYRASAVSARDIWAVAATHQGGSVEHYDGHAWRLVPIAPALAKATMDDVLARSRDSVWIVGNMWVRHGEGRLFLAHFDGHRWTVRVTSRTADTGRLAATRSEGIWITADATGTRTDALVGRLAGDLDDGGRLTWAPVRGGLGSGISDIAAGRGSSRVWLSGGFLTQSGGDAAIWSRAGIRTGDAGTARLEIRPGPVPLEVRSWRKDLTRLLEPRHIADLT
jgi:hypothetical protein